ncbi:metallophosphoesterase family protein [Leptospira sp. GIMC2001]|uniref:metallophosphoesterase family protein n=1 Tax=Leptospira sp. GIMC2001 TaxID=1513297 RepID=UPI00234B72E6|nr:metallophosphoesterase [Leptospira sp. GIMC2001]WCL48994.1 metallophosphoesterase [Leptospira sp. GIMC2001]
MAKILHTSDLHFSKDDLDYCLDVWKEILDIGTNNNVEALIISGDVFNTFQDLIEAREPFVQATSNIDYPIYCISGNHEYLGLNNRSLGSYDLGKIHWIHSQSFQIFESRSKSWELVAIPYSTKYSDYRDWKIPTKSKPRIIMAHGLIPEILPYTGPDEEEGDHIIELDMLARFNPDYVALGHIHRRTVERLQNLPIYYPGSPRVWRKGEKFERSVNLINIDDSGSINTKPITVEKAGQFIALEWNLDVNGTLPVIDLANTYKAQDYIYVDVLGFSDKESNINQQMDQIKNIWDKKFRKFEISSSNVRYLEGISDLSLVQKFLKTWESKKPDSTNEAQTHRWIRARQIGLEAIANAVEGSK